MLWNFSSSHHSWKLLFKSWREKQSKTTRWIYQYNNYYNRANASRIKWIQNAKLLWNAFTISCTQYIREYCVFHNLYTSEYFHYKFLQQKRALIKDGCSRQIALSFWMKLSSLAECFSFDETNSSMTPKLNKSPAWTSFTIGK